MRRRLTASTILLIAAILFASCGDDGGSRSSPVANPGTFAGSTSGGGTILLEVASIDAVDFDCGADEVRHVFSPPQRVSPQGRFDVVFSELGRRFQLGGTFVTPDRVTGTIEDPAHVCSDSFIAERLVAGTPAPTRAVTTPAAPTQPPGAPPPPPTSTFTPTLTPTATQTPTATATGTLIPTSTPTQTATPHPQLCGDGITEGTEDCDSAYGSCTVQQSGNYVGTPGTCACCYCRPTPIAGHQDPQTTACSTCHSGTNPPYTLTSQPGSKTPTPGNGSFCP